MCTIIKLNGKTVNVKGIELNEGEVYETTDYDFFEVLSGNRQNIEDRAAKLVDDILRNEADGKSGILPVYIIINDRAEVIEGQARLLAMKTLNRPVRFVMSVGLDIDDAIRMNANSTSWNVVNYVHAWSEKGYPCYRDLEANYKAYKQYIAISNIAKIMQGIISRNHNTQYISLGKFSTSAKREHYKIVLDKTKNMIRATTRSGFVLRGRKDILVSAFTFLAIRNTLPNIIVSGVFDEARLITKLSTSDNKTVPFDSIEDVLDLISNIYNAGLRKNQVNLSLEYVKFMNAGLGDNMYKYFDKKK